MKRAVVCGAGGFIAGHLVKRLVRDGYWVRGVDIKEHEFAPSAAQEFRVLDLRDMAQCRQALEPVDGQPIDEVYQLAAEMGGMGFISTAECEIMRNSALINVNMPQAAAEAGVSRYFLSSSVCIYRDMAVGEAPSAGRSRRRRTAGSLKSGAMGARCARIRTSTTSLTASSASCEAIWVDRRTSGAPST